MGNYTGSLDTLWWSPEEYEALAQDLTQVGQKYEEFINAAAEAINALGANGAWKGYLYNQLVERFNEEISKLNDDAEQLTNVIPTAISNQAQAQAAANNGMVEHVNLASLAGIINVQTTEDDGKGSVYIDPVQVDAGVNTFIDNLNGANAEAQKYLSLFQSTVCNGLNVSEDIKLMENNIEIIINNVQAFNQQFSAELEDCARNSAAIMSSAAEASASEANTIQQ